MKDEEQSRTIVLPGELLDETGDYKPGPGTYRMGGRLYAKRMGLKSMRTDQIEVVALGGVYDPVAGDLVIGVVMEHGTSNWIIDVNGPYPAPLHVNEVPWKVGFAETSQFLESGDAVLCKILFVDEAKKVQVTMNDRNLRKLVGGHLIDVSPSRVPRIIGRNGSMVNLIKKFTDIWLFVGQNGRIWMNGEPESINIATEAVRKIEREAHIPGLTERIQQFLSERTGRSIDYEETDQEEE